MWHSVKKLFSGNAEEDALVDGFVQIVEPKLKQVRGYRRKLVKPLQLCRVHCRALIEQLPGPFQLNISRYSDDPVTNIVFTDSNDIAELVRRAELQDSSMPGVERVALLTMTSREKTIFGRRTQGEMVVGDVAMRAITFDNHNIVGLAPSLEQTRIALETLSMQIIAEAAARQLSEMRTRLVDLQQRREHLKAMKKMFGESSGSSGLAVPYDPEWHQKQKQLAEMLEETESELNSAADSGTTPERWLEWVEQFLSNPQDILSMHQISLRLDWKNVLTEDPREKAHTLNLASFSLSEELQREALLISYSIS